MPNTSDPIRREIRYVEFRVAGEFRIIGRSLDDYSGELTVNETRVVQHEVVDGVEFLYPVDRTKYHINLPDGEDAIVMVDFRLGAAVTDSDELALTYEDDTLVVAWVPAEQSRSRAREHLLQA